MVGVRGATLSSSSGVAADAHHAHTIAFDAPRNKVYAFLPATHRAAVYQNPG